MYILEACTVNGFEVISSHPRAPLYSGQNYLAQRVSLLQNLDTLYTWDLYQDHLHLISIAERVLL